MGTFANIVCKTVGVAGISAALYDAGLRGCAESRRVEQMVSADYFERIHSSTRTLSSESHVNGAIQNKIADMRMDNPIVPVYGQIKGFCKGFFNSLGQKLIPISFAALAIGTKGFFSKLGAWGVAGWAALTVLREGFGVGKINPHK